MNQPQGLELATKAVEANRTSRYKALEELERWVEGSQYDDRPGFWSDDVPLWERAPCIVYPVVEIAIGSFVDLLFGEGRFPEFTSRPGEDETKGLDDDTDGEDVEDDENDNALDEKDSARLDAFLKQYHKLAMFRAYAREGLEGGMGCGTAVGIHGVRNGKPFAELIPAKWATPEFDIDQRVTSLEIRYPYIEERRDPSGTVRFKAMLFRRVIDTESDTTYLPAEASEYGADPAWQADPKQTYKHNLGFCPVVWYAHLRGTRPVNEIDGKAIHERVTDEIQAHDIARSQWHRCALFSEPQIVEIGVNPGYNPTAPGRTAMVPATEAGGRITANNPQRGGYVEGESEEARKKGPGHIWQYTSKDARIEQLETPSDALKAQQDNCSDLRIKIQEALCVVFLDPENIKFAATTSGKALEAIKARQVDRAGKIREDITERFLLPSIEIQLRIAHKLRDSIRVPGIKRVLKVLDQFAKGESWSQPHVSLRWGAFFAPDPEDQAKIIKVVREALGGETDTPLITLRHAVEKIAPVFGIEDVDAVMAELEEERAGRAEEAAARAEREQKALHDLAKGLNDEDAGADRDGGGSKPPKARSRRGKRPAAAGAPAE